MGIFPTDDDESTWSTWVISMDCIVGLKVWCPPKNVENLLVEFHPEYNLWFSLVGQHMGLCLPSFGHY